MKNIPENTMLNAGGKRELTRDMLTSDPLCEQISPDAIVNTWMDHLEVVDMGETSYYRGFYVESLPKEVRFAGTFEPLYSAPYVSTSVVVSALAEGRAIQMFNKKVEIGERESYSAADADATNRKRRVDRQIAESVYWSDQAERGRKFYVVRWIFLVRGESLEKLKKNCAVFVTKAEGRGVQLVSCYGMQLEAFLAAGPYNKVYSGPKGTSFTVKGHVLSDSAVAAVLFNHVNTYFSHPDGVPLGRTLDSGSMVLFDPYAKSHSGYSAAFIGIVGTGKSAACKMLASRLIPVGYRFACVDVQQVAGMGEYARLCEYVGGVNYIVNAGSRHKLNIFELNEHFVWEEQFGRYRRDLDLKDKVESVCEVFMVAIVGTKTKPDFELATYMEILLKNCITEIYGQHGIFHGEPDSLYEDADAVETGTISSGRRKKMLPTISELYLRILTGHRFNTVPLHEKAWQILEDTVGDLVDDVAYYFDEERQEYVEADIKVMGLYEAAGRQIFHVSGTRGYFDGQSTVSISGRYPFINIDISEMPEESKRLGQLVALSFLGEYFIKPNSDRAEDADKLILIADEAHMHFRDPAAVAYLTMLVRTVRKRNSGIWTITQNLSDFDLNDDTRAILSNCSSTFIFKQNSIDKESLIKNTSLTGSQVDRLLSMGGDPNEDQDAASSGKKSGGAHKGEVCLVDMGRAIFLKTDYLQATEAPFVSTDMEELKRIKSGR